MPQKDISNNAIVDELDNTVVIQTDDNTVINKSKKSQITTLLESNLKRTSNLMITESSPIIIQPNNEMEDVNTHPSKEEKNNHLAPYSYTDEKVDASSPIAIHPPPPPTALNQFSFNPKALIPNAENINSNLNSKSSKLDSNTAFQNDQDNNIKEHKSNSSLVTPSSVHLLPQDNLYSQSYKPTCDITNSITGSRLSSSFTYKNNLLASVNTGRRPNVTFTKGIPISENVAIKTHRMHRKRTMRLTKQAQSEVGEYYNFDVNLLLQISVEQWVDFITITTFYLWQHPNIQPSPTFMDEVYDNICEADSKEKNYFFAYRRFLYQFMVKTSPNPFVILYAIVYLFKLREGVPDEVVTPRSETFVFPVVVMIADKFIQDVHQLPAKYWALAAKMDAEDLILFQRKVMKYLGYSLLVNYDEIDNVVTLLEEFILRELELDNINKSMSSPSSSNSYPTPPMSHNNSVDYGFSMFNDNIDSTNMLDTKEAEILIYTFRKLLNEQPEYIPIVIVQTPKYRKHRSLTVIDGDFGEDEGIEGDDEREDYKFNRRHNSPAVITSYTVKNQKSMPLSSRSSRAKLSASIPKSMNIDNRSKRISVGYYSNVSISPHPSTNHDDSYNQKSINNYNPNRRSINDPYYVYEGKNPHHKLEDLEFKKYNSSEGKKVSMLSKAMNLLKNDKKSKSSKNASSKSSTPVTLPRNFKSSKFKTRSSSTLNIHDDRDSPNPQSVTDVQSGGFGPYFTGSGKSNKRNSKSLMPLNNRHSMSTMVSVNSQNKRYSLPAYATNFKFNGAMDTCYSNPPENNQTISIINKKSNGSETPEDYLFKDPPNYHKNPAANLNKKSPVKPKLVTKLVSKSSEKTLNKNKIKLLHKYKSFDDTQGAMTVKTPSSQFDKSLTKEKEPLIEPMTELTPEPEPEPELTPEPEPKQELEQESEQESEQEQDSEQEKDQDIIDYTQTVNMLKSIPFGDEEFVKSMDVNALRRDDSEEVASFVKPGNNGLKQKSSKTSFLFSKRKNHLKSGSHNNITEDEVHVKKHNKSKSVVNENHGSSKKNHKKFYTVGHNHSESSMNLGNYFEKPGKHFQGNYFSKEFESSPPSPNMNEEDEENVPANKIENNTKSSAYPKRNGSNKSMKWFGKIMKTIQLKK